MLKVDPVNLICTVLNLLILFVALRIFLFKPVLKIIAARQEEAERQFAEADSAKEEADKLKSEYEQSLADAEKQRQQILQTARIDADAQYQKIVEDAKDRAKEIEEKAVAEAKTRKEKLIRNTEKELAEMVVNAAGKIAANQNGAELDSSLYDEFLIKAGEKK